MTGLIGAIPEEITHLAAALTDAVTETHLGMTFYRGVLAGEPVVITRAGVGKVNAALAAGAMALLYHPDRLINTGVAGALAGDLKQGDVVVATSLVEYDMDTTPFGEPRGLLQIRGQELVELPADGETVAALTRAAGTCGETPRTGMIATGDRFVAGADAKAAILSYFPALACEMEGAAIAHAAYAAGVPVAVLRVVSDSADGSAQLDYPTFAAIAAEKCQRIVCAYLAALHG